MGVYIPNVEMPRGCNSCPLVMEIDNTCSLTMGGCTKDERPPHCQLIDIVTCGECKWWNRDGKRKDGKGWCENAICGLTKPNAFCSYGERRADETNIKR